MLRKSIVVAVLVVALAGFAGVAWAGGAGPGWGPGHGSMMRGDGSDGGPWDQGSRDDMAAWMEQMHGPGWASPGEGSWEDMARWMEETYGSSPGVCPHRRYPSPGAGEAPAG